MIFLHVRDTKLCVSQWQIHIKKSEFSLINLFFYKLQSLGYFEKKFYVVVAHHLFWNFTWNTKINNLTLCKMKTPPIPVTSTLNNAMHRALYISHNRCSVILQWGLVYLWIYCWSKHSWINKRQQKENNGQDAGIV